MPSNIVGSFYEINKPDTVYAWFNKDNNGYCVIFTKTGAETSILYDNSGNVLKTEVDSNNDDDSKTESKDSGCQCELENENESETGEKD